MNRKSVTVNGNTYSVIVYSPSTSSKPTILFLHGFPSHSLDFAHQITFFRKRGYGILAPDLLGYGQSEKPDDVSLYTFKPMSDDLAAILDAESIDKVIGVGHDFGATLLSRFVAYHPTRLIATIFLSVGPPKLGTAFNLDGINAMTKQALGYELLGYINWLGRDEGAATILEANSESAMSLAFCADEAKLWPEWFRPLGKCEQFVTEGRKVPVADWYPPDLQEAHLKVFGAKDGYKGACKWYKMWTENLWLSTEAAIEKQKIMCPTLFVGDDEMQEGMLREWSADFEVAKIKSGHWVHLEKKDETCQAIEEFLKKRGLGS